MLSTVTKCRLVFISILLLLSLIAWRNKAAIQDSMTVATSNGMKRTTSLSTPPPKSSIETVILLDKIAIPHIETPVLTGEPINVVEPTLTTQVSFTTTIVISPAAISHRLNGVGVHIFDNDHANPKFEDALDELKLKYLRVPFGPEWNTLSNEPPDCNNEDDYQLMYTFISNNFNGDYPIRLTNAISTSAIAQSLGIEIILVNWRAHKKWVTNDEFKELMEIYLDDYACFVVAVVEFLTNNGVNINYLEPTNEPSDTSDTKIPPERYNRFVKTLRQYLERQGLSNVKVLGPGLAYLNHDNTGKIWVEALDGEGVDALSVWASHAWDPVFSNGSEEGILKMKWEEFQKEIKEQESLLHPNRFLLQNMLV
jgi:hypothetical protein